MKEIMDCLNSNVGLLNLLFTSIVTIATITYAGLTWSLVAETKRMRRAQTDPAVSIRIESSETSIGFINFVVYNEGMGPAYNVQFVLEQIPGSRCSPKVLDHLQALGFIQKGIGYFAPRQQIASFLASVYEGGEDLIASRFNLIVKYQTQSGENKKNSYRIDFSEFKGLRRIEKPPLVLLAKKIEEIQKDVHDLVTGWQKLNIIISTKAEVEAEEQQLLEVARKQAEEV